MPLPSWAREVESPEEIPSRSWYDAPSTTPRRTRSVPAWYAHAGMGHSIGLGYLILTLLGIIKPAPDGLVDFFVVREPPPWAGEG